MSKLFLRPFKNIFLLEFYLYALTHNKFLLIQKTPLLMEDIAVKVFTKGIKKANDRADHSLFTIKDL